MQDPYKDFKVTKLPRNGPKPGQSTDAWVFGKTAGFQRDKDKADHAKAQRKWRHKW